MEKLQEFMMEQEDNIETTENKDKSTENACVNCNHIDLYFDLNKGYNVCTNCGTINNKILDTNAEWRYYNSDDGKIDPSRCGCPSNPYLPKSSLGTMSAPKAAQRLNDAYISSSSIISAPL